MAVQGEKDAKEYKRTEILRRSIQEVKKRAAAMHSPKKYD